MRYFYTYNYYYDCPTCDGISEEAQLSSIFDNEFDLLKNIQEYVNQYSFENIYSLTDSGYITLEDCPVIRKGGHKVLEVSYNLNGHKYSVIFNKDEHDWKIETSNEGYKRMYSDE